MYCTLYYCTESILCCTTLQNDPLGIMTEQINQLDSKQSDQDLKLTQLDAKLSVSLFKHCSIAALQH
eukprot:COSAG06_NODE_6065_length_3128_cov_3076.287554_1_plen_67_part_00